MVKSLYIIVTEFSCLSREICKKAARVHIVGFMGVKEEKKHKTEKNIAKKLLTREKMHAIL